MLKRVVRRVLGTPSSDERGMGNAPKPTTPAPRDTPTPEPPRGGIAARIAAGVEPSAKPTVAVTSGTIDDGLLDETIRKSDDGTRFWGKLNNESAQAKADGQTLVIDQWECIACGTCVENTDAVFILPDDAKATVIQQHGNMGLIQDAIDACPVTCIHWSHEPEHFEQLNDDHGDPL